MGQDVLPFLSKILQLTKTGISKQDLVSNFDNLHINTVDKLTDMLLERNILYVATDTHTNKHQSETPEDIFFWHLTSDYSPRQILYAKKILITGQSAITNHLLEALELTGFKNIILIQDSQSNSPKHMSHTDKKYYSVADFNEISHEQFDCIITTTDTNATETLSTWNKICVEKECHYFPLALDNVHGYIGPYIIPYQTPCYECLLARQSSHYASYDLRQQFNQASVDSYCSNGFHPMMPLVLAGIACMELAKIFTKAYTQNIGRLISVNFITQQMQTRKILRVPNCKLCNQVVYA